MRFIDTKIHAVIDYLMGILLIVAPWLLGFADGGADQWVPVILGLGTIFYSIITDYEYGLLKVLSVKAHLIIDLIAGIFLAVSPWLFGFADDVYLPHLILGIAEIGVSCFTKKHSSYPETSLT